MKTPRRNYHVLSQDELFTLFARICSGEEPNFDPVTKDRFSDLVSNSITVEVTGKYEGTISLTRNNVYSASKTDIDTKEPIGYTTKTNNYPYFIAAVIFTAAACVAVYQVLRKSIRRPIFAIIYSILMCAVVALISYLIFSPR